MDAIISDYVRSLLQGYFKIIVEKFSVEEDDPIKIYARTMEIYKGEKKPIQRAKNVNVEQENKDIIRKLRTQDIRRVLKDERTGNFVDSDGLVWSKETSRVIGRQVDDSVRRLTKEDIELCNSKFLMYDTRMIE